MRRCPAAGRRERRRRACCQRRPRRTRAGSRRMRRPGTSSPRRPRRSRSPPCRPLRMRVARWRTTRSLRASSSSARKLWTGKRRPRGRSKPSPREQHRPRRRDSARRRGARPPASRAGEPWRPELLLTSRLARQWPAAAPPAPTTTGRLQSWPAEWRQAHRGECPGSKSRRAYASWARREVNPRTAGPGHPPRDRLRRLWTAARRCSTGRSSRRSQLSLSLNMQVLLKCCGADPRSKVC